MSEQINVSSIKEAVQRCCNSDGGCSSCQGKACLVGFAKIVTDYAGAKKALTIPNGVKMVPSCDFKVYEPDDVAYALAVINNECKNCMDNHDDNCVINIIRSALEVALVGEHIEFSGNPLVYMMNLSNVNAELGGKVMEAYRTVKKG